MDAASSAANWITSINLTLQILLGASLKLLWSMVNTIQFVVFFTDWPVQIPNNAYTVIEFFRSVALGEFIPKYEVVVDFVAGPFQNDSGENVVSGFGIMLIFGGILLIIALLVTIMSRCCRQGSKCQ